jgi:ABC-2 type transport system ATP-binding protein
VSGLAEVANALTQSGHEVEDLSLRQPTLDEVFLNLTGMPMDAEDLDRSPQEVSR